MHAMHACTAGGLRPPDLAASDWGATAPNPLLGGWRKAAESPLPEDHALSSQTIWKLLGTRVAKPLSESEHGDAACPKELPQTDENHEKQSLHQTLGTPRTRRNHRRPMWASKSEAVHSLESPTSDCKVDPETS